MPSSKILLWVLASIVWLFLIYITFLTPTNYAWDFSMEAYKIWFFSVEIKEDETINETQINYSSSWSQGGLIVDKINIVDSVFFSSGNYNKVQEWNTITLNFGAWEYLIDIRSTGYKYKVNTESFSLDILWPGKVYVNTLDSKNCHIFSIDSLSRFYFKWEKQWTPIYIYPHMYIWFNSLMWKFYLEADFFRILTVFEPIYFWEKLFSWTMVDNNLFSKIPALETVFFKDTLFILNSEYDDSENKLGDFSRLDLVDFPGIEYIEKYKKVFLNETKRRVYNKDLILKNVLRLLKAKKYEPSVIDSIYNSLEELRVYEEDYKEMEDSINAYYRLVSINSDPSFEDAKLNVYQLVLKVNDMKELLDYKSFLPLNAIYSYFDFDNRWDYLYDSLVTFSNTFFVKFSKGGSDEEETGVIFKDYFYFFLKEIFLSKFVLDKDNNSDLFKGDNLKNLLDVMEQYIALSKEHYSTSWKHKEAVYIYRLMLEKLERFIRLWFFNEKRWEGNLLEVKGTNGKNHEYMKTLEWNINKLFNFFNASKTHLPEDSLEEESYTKLKEMFVEYFFALDDFNGYKMKYDKGIIKIFEENEELDDDEELTEKDFVNYLSQFNWLRLDDAKIEIEVDYYKATSIFIDWKMLSFYLYPYDNHKMDKIKLDGKDIGFTYKLWKEENNEDFFIDTFVKKEEKEVPIYIEEEEKGEELYISVFKRDKLLWEGWDFVLLKGILEVGYSDINVIRDELGNYDISVENAKMYIWKNSKFSFFSDYIRNWRTKAFKNIEVKPYKNGEVLDIMPIKIIWVITLQNFKEDIDDIFSNFVSVDYIFNKILSVLYVEDISVTYTLKKSKFNFKFDYKGKVVNIILDWDKIENIFVWDSTDGLILSPTSYLNIEKYLKKVKLTK